MSNIKEFNEFVDEVARRLPSYLSEYEVDKICVEDVRKNNGVEYKSIVIILKNEKISPSIYMEYFYELYRNGVALKNVLEDIVKEYKNARKDFVKAHFYIPNKDGLKDKIFLRLVNYEKNKIALQESPYIMYHDLAITFRYLVKQDETGIASALIHKKNLEEWNCTVDELYEIAKENTKKLFPPVLKRLDEMFKEFDYEVFTDSVKLYVLTNELGINGATSLIYDEFLSGFSNEHKADFYILPSSIHEVLFLPHEEGMNKETMEEMVKEINEYVVSPIEFLSDTVYVYDSKESCVKI